MNQQPDKLFRDKVEELKITVPANAWSRVEANLDKKNNGAFWMKIAASLLLIAASVFLFMPKSQPSQVKIASKKEVPKISSPKKNAEQQSAPQAQVTRTSDPKQNQSTNIGEKKKVIRSAKKTKAKENLEQEKSIEQSIASAIETPAVESLEQMPVIEEKTTEPVVAQTEKKTSHISIVITATEADEKYLDKKSLAEATSDEKKSSTLRKLLDTAYDLKNNQEPFGDLRQKKNEILALNFKSEKQRSQNK